MQNTIDESRSSVKDSLSGEWFGKTDPESKDGASPYGNNEDFIIHNYDIAEVEESYLAGLPAYDFSGPAATGQAGTIDESLMSNNTDDDSTAEDGNIEVSGNKKIFLVPLYCGVSSSDWLINSEYSLSAYRERLKDKTVASYSQFCNGDYSHPLTPSTTNGFGLSYFPGFANSKLAGDTHTYCMWRTSWNICANAKKQLEQDGYTVCMPGIGTGTVGRDSTPSVVWKNRKNADMNTIAKRIKEESPDYVLFVGFNEMAFSGGSQATAEWNANTTIFLSFSKTTTTSNVKKKFAKANNLPGEVKYVSCDSTRLYQQPGTKAAGKAAALSRTYGFEKARTALYSLKVIEEDCKAGAVMLGGLAGNTGDGKYYHTTNAVGGEIAAAIEAVMK